jgi:glycine cleavage system transcriptional repressor
MKNRFLLIAGGIDRRGIVYSLTQVLKRHEFNIEDSSMVMLRRTFSVIMLLSHEGMYDLKKFDPEIAAFSKRSGMTLELKKISEKEMKEYGGEGKTYTISISGADKPGIVNSITSLLYKSGANIIDLETKSSEKVVPHAYYMFLEVDLQKKTDAKKLEAALVKLGKKLGVHVTFSGVEKAIL